MRSPISSNRPAARSPAGASHEPPRAITLGTASQSPSRSSAMPPVGVQTPGSIGTPRSTARVALRGTDYRVETARPNRVWSEA